MSEKFKFYREAVNYGKEAVKTVIPEKIRNWEELNQSILELAKEKKKPEFKERIINTWKEFAVSGVLQFDKEKGEQILKPFTDLDGKCSLGLLELSGFNVSNLTYVRPGKYLEGAINLDTGDKFGVVYEEPSYTLYFYHHKLGTKEVTSTAEIVYKTLVGLRLLKKTEALDRVVGFVTKIDNRKYPPEEFLKSAKTILGLQRELDFNKLFAYFNEHESPTEELAAEEFEKYNLRQAAEEQQKIIDELMDKLKEMEGQGRVVATEYGSLLINENNELKTGSSAAYIRHDGVLNYTPDKSFTVTFKDKDIDEKEIKGKLGNKFQGKIIRGKMWIYNEKEPLKLKLFDIIDGLRSKKYFPEKEIQEKIEHIKNVINPHIEQIKELRKNKKEVGGRIVDNKIELVDENQQTEDSVIFDTYEKERDLGESGIINFHTHPDNGLDNESGQDILATYFSFGQVIFSKNKILIHIPEKRLEIDEIKKIDEEVWNEAQQEEEQTGEFAYWTWKGKLKKRLPTRVVEIKK